MATNFDWTFLYWQDEATGETEFLQFDAVTSLSPEDPSTITDHPVERGANVVDHIREEPERLSLEAIVSTTPNAEIDDDVALEGIDLRFMAVPTGGTETIELKIPSPPIQPDPNGLVQAGIGAIGNALFGGPKAQVNVPGQGRAFNVQAQALQQSSPRNRVRDIYEKLLEVKRKHILISITTRDRDYTELAIERLATQRTADNSGSTIFQLDFRRIRVAASETVLAPKPAEARGTTTKNKGSQPTEEEEGPKAQQWESILKQGKDAVFGS